MANPDKVLSDLESFYGDLTPEEYFEHLRRANPGLDVSFDEERPRERRLALILSMFAGWFHRHRLHPAFAIGCVALIGAAGIVLGYIIHKSQTQELIKAHEETIEELSVWPSASLEAYEKMEDVLDRLGTSAGHLRVNLEDVENHIRKGPQQPTASVERPEPATEPGYLGPFIEKIAEQKEDVIEIEYEIEQLKGSLHEIRGTVIPASLRD